MITYRQALMAYYREIAGPRGEVYWVSGFQAILFDRPDEDLVVRLTRFSEIAREIPSLELKPEDLDPGGFKEFPIDLIYVGSRTRGFNAVEPEDLVRGSVPDIYLPLVGEKFLRISTESLDSLKYKETNLRKSLEKQVRDLQ